MVKLRCPHCWKLYKNLHNHINQSTTCNQLNLQQMQFRDGLESDTPSSHGPRIPSIIVCLDNKAGPGSPTRRLLALPYASESEVQEDLSYSGDEFTTLSEERSENDEGLDEGLDDDSVVADIKETLLHHQQRHIPDGRHQLACHSFFTKQEKLVTRLLDLLDAANCPLYMCDEIIRIVRQSAIEGLDFLRAPIVPSRRSYITAMFKRFKVPIPRAVQVKLEESTRLVDPDCTQIRRTSTPVVCYDFLEQMNDLLCCNKTFGEPANFVGTINMEDPFSCKPPRDDNGYVDEIVDGKWYRDTYNKISSTLVDEVAPLFILPVVIYVDKTGTDPYRKYGLEPLLFTTAILNRKARCKRESWRVLGYIPDLQQSSKASKEADRTTQVGRGRATRNYHYCLQKVLHSFEQNQGFNDRVYGHVKLGEQVQYCRLFFPLAFVIGDALSGDGLCGRYSGRYNNVARISRNCWTSFEDADDPHHRCILTSSGDFTQPSHDYLKYCGIIVDDSEIPTKQVAQASLKYLHECSQHAHVNAFQHIWFGENPRGINGATPNDLMHLFLLGVVQRCLQVFFSGFTSFEKAQLDCLIDNTHNTHRSSESKNFPRCTFRKGITNLKLLTADEWIGVVFSLAITTMSPKGYRLIQSVLMRLSNDKEKTDPHHYLQLWEMLLCFHAWYKRGAPFLINSVIGQQQCDHAISSLLSAIRDRLPRMEANEWKLQKFHEVLHVPHDISMWGSPANYDSASGERMLIHFAKQPSKRTVKRILTFVPDVNARLWEQALIAKVVAAQPTVPGLVSYRNRTLFDNNKNGKNCDVDNSTTSSQHLVSSFLPGQPKFVIQHEELPILVNPGTTYSRIIWKWLPGRSSHQIHPVVMRWFQDEIRKPGQGVWQNVSQISCWTEYSRDGKLFRAHPNFASSGPWYDWVMIKFDDNVSVFDEDSLSRTSGYFGRQYYPSKVLCFFRLEGSDDISALVHSCVASDHQSDSVVMERWHLEYESDTSTRKKRRTSIYLTPVIHRVDVESFGDRILVNEDDGRIVESIVCPRGKASDSTKFPGVTVILPRNHWPSQFL